jgi:hypothetical protein
MVVFGRPGILVGKTRIAATLAPDNRSLSILFDSLKLEPKGTARNQKLKASTIGIRIPVVQAENAPRVHCELRGAVLLGAEAARAGVMAWIDGKAVPIPVVDGAIDCAELIENVSTPCLDVLIVLVARSGPGSAGQALVQLDSIDLADAE